MLQDYTAYASFQLTHNPRFRRNVQNSYLARAAFEESRGNKAEAERLLDIALTLDEKNEKE